jgi:outer membrane protein OmpA-like peptidoglycan-associated protein
MPVSRIDKHWLVWIMVAVGLTCVAPQWAAGQDLPQECKALWANLEAAAKARDLKAAAAGEREIAIDPICNAPLSVAAKEVLLGLHREEDTRLELAGAAPAVRLTALNAALRYANQWNAWDIHARIGDLKRRLPAAGGRPDYAGVSLAYDEAVRAIDQAPASSRPAAAVIQRIVGLAYQYEALSPAPVPRRGGITRTARQVNVERTPVPLQFVYDSDQLTDAGQTQAENLFKLLKEVGMPQLHLVGHTDPVGSDEYNDKLSVRRAVAIRNFLMERGYPAQRVTTEGRGKRDIEKLRIWDGDQFTVEQIHQMLRRVELVWKQ